MPLCLHWLPPRILSLVAITLAGCSSVPDQRLDVGGIAIKVGSNPGFVRNDRTERFRDDSKVLHDVVYRLQVGSRDLCGRRVSYELGFSYLNRAMLQRLALPDKNNLFGAEETLKIFHVVPGSPADRAGLKPEDYIYQVNTNNLPQSGESSAEELHATLTSAMHSGEPVQLGLRRGNNLFSTILQPEKACDFNVHLEDARYSGVSWDADQNEIGVSMTALHDFGASGVAILIAHEAAHVLLHHNERAQILLKKAAVADTPFGLASIYLNTISMGGLGGKDIAPFRAATEKKLNAEFEPQADLLTLYMLAASGYPVDSLVAAMQKNGHPLSNHVKWTSDGKEAIRVRIEKIQKEAAMIAENSAKGLPLLSDPSAELLSLLTEVNSDAHKQNDTANRPFGN